MGVQSTGWAWCNHLRCKRSTDFAEKRDDLRPRIAGVQSFERKIPTVAGPIDDGLDPFEVDGLALSIATHFFLDLPRYCVGDELFDLGVWVARAQASDVEDAAEPIGPNGVGELDGFGRKEFVSTLRMFGYDGVLSIEHEDSLFSPEEGLTRATHFLSDIVLREQPAAPWWV
jgi:hypothetical protein